MRVLHVCSEFYPVLKTGGLADVTGALPLELSKIGCDSRLLVPGFPEFMDPLFDRNFLLELPPKFGAKSIRLYTMMVSNTLIYVIDAPDLYNRPGNPYADADNHPYEDNHLRFALLSFVAVLIADKLDKTWSPSIIHSHDWHAGLVGAYLKSYELKYSKKLAASVFTIHNLAYQGLFKSQLFKELDLPREFFQIDGLEFYGQISFLKAGIFFADKITTVSPSYANEIQTSIQGCGLDGLLRHRQNDLIGILNGVDDNIWNPALDKLIQSKYTARSIAGKLKCKVSLQKQLGLTVQKDKVLFVMVTRLTEQKGINLVLSGLEQIIANEAQLVILGSGDKEIEDSLIELASKYPNSISVQIGYDENQAHRLIAGGDVILVPSRFEPCGLTQLYGLKYGTLPLVHKVGGLSDTVKDVSLENLADNSANGFVFDRFNEVDFDQALRRVFALYSSKKLWTQVQLVAMDSSYDWESVAHYYLDLYKKLGSI